MKYVEEKVRKKLSNEAKEVIVVSSFGLCAAGVIFGPTVCIICDNLNENKYFKYSVNESGEYTADGTMNYEKLKECFFVEIENPSWKSTEFYICRKEKTYYNNGSECKYINLLNDKQIFKSTFGGLESENENENNGRKIVNEILLEDYLYAFDEVKAEYTPDDVRNMLEKMKEATLEEKESVLVVNSNLSNAFTKVKKI